MRQSVLAVCTLFILIAATPAQSGEDVAFFDLENCAMCSHLLEDPALMAGVGWEHHNVAEGMMSITTFLTEEAMLAYTQARADMETTAAQLMAGEELYLCGFCQSTMGLMMAGAQREEVPFEGGIVMLMTSNDGEIVQQIHRYCDTINMELQAIESMEG